MSGGAEEQGGRGAGEPADDIGALLATLPELPPLRPEFAAELRARMAAANKMRVPGPHKMRAPERNK